MNSLAWARNEAHLAGIWKGTQWDLERNTDLYKKAERCEEMYSNGRQPKPLSEDSLSAGARMMHTNSLQRTGSAQGITEGGSHRRA